MNMRKRRPIRNRPFSFRRPGPSSDFSTMPFPPGEPSRLKTPMSILTGRSSLSPGNWMPPCQDWRLQDRDVYANATNVVFRNGEHLQVNMENASPSEDYNYYRVWLGTGAPILADPRPLDTRCAETRRLRWFNDAAHRTPDRATGRFRAAERRGTLSKAMRGAFSLAFAVAAALPRRPAPPGPRSPSRRSIRSSCRAAAGSRSAMGRRRASPWSAAISRRRASPSGATASSRSTPACARPDYELEVEIVTPVLEGVGIEGGGSIRAEGAFPDRDALALGISGGGEIDMRAIRAAASPPASTAAARSSRMPATGWWPGSMAAARSVILGEPTVTSGIDGGGSIRPIEAR